MPDGWVPIAKSCVRCLPKDRPYGKLEAVYSLAVDYNEGKLVSISGYAKLWGWSRNKVRKFLDDLDLEIEYPADTARCQKQWGQIEVRKGTDQGQIKDRKAKNREQITFIDFKDLQAHRDRKTEKRGQKRGRSGSTTLKNNKNIFSATSVEYSLSKLLLDLILERRNSFKKPNLQRWAVEVDLMIRIDGRDPAEIKKVIQWCQADHFWQKNILSTAKLRQQYDQLVMKMDETPKKEKGAWDHIPER